MERSGAFRGGHDEADVAAREHQNRCLPGAAAAVERHHRRVLDREELLVAAVDVVGKPAAVALARQREHALDPIPVRFDYHPLPPDVHAADARAFALRARRQYLEQVDESAGPAPEDGGAALEAVFKPVDPPTTFEETVERLGTAIRLGLLPPGRQLPPERDLAALLRISRSTLRQAITTLVESGHLVSLRGRTGGTFVVETPPLSEVADEPFGEEARAVLDYRVAVETGATVLGAERATEDDLAKLDKLVDRMSNPDGFEDYRRADVRFHIGIAEAAHSPRLVSAMTEVQGDVSDLIALIPHPQEVLTQSNAQHRRLVVLLRGKDAGAAAALIREHIRGTEHILAGLL